MCAVDFTSCYLRPENSVVTEDIEDMVDPNSTAGSSIEAEDKEESLISSADTVTKEEAVMIQNVDTTS